VDVTPLLGGADDFITPLTGVKAKCCCSSGACDITPLEKLKTRLGYQGGCGELGGHYHSYLKRTVRGDGLNECMIPRLSKEEHFGKDGEEKFVTKGEL
jgi:hypothetical protein